MMLGDFLKAQMRVPGRWHCSTLAADWCLSLGYPDFAAAWREVCEPADCDATAAEAGGLIRLWDEGIGTGLPVACDPYQPGDIAVVTALGIEAGGIWTGERWAVRSMRGLAFLAPDRLAIIKAWRP